VNPYDGSPIPHAAHIASKEDVDTAVAAATTAFKTTWGKLAPSERAKCMLRFADLVEQNADRLAALESLPTGKPVSPTKGFEIAHMVEVYRCMPPLIYS
jgi:aldehyde dehydrogenase (NAD+)